MSGASLIGFDDDLNKIIDNKTRELLKLFGKLDKRLYEDPLLSVDLQAAIESLNKKLESDMFGQPDSLFVSPQVFNGLKKMLEDKEDGNI
jgi:hypothetical protein